MQILTLKMISKSKKKKRMIMFYKQKNEYNSFISNSRNLERLTSKPGLEWYLESAPGCGLIRSHLK